MKGRYFWQLSNRDTKFSVNFYPLFQIIFQLNELNKVCVVDENRFSIAFWNAVWPHLARHSVQAICLCMTLIFDCDPQRSHQTWINGYGISLYVTLWPWPLTQNLIMKYRWCKFGQYPITLEKSWTQTFFWIFAICDLDIWPLISQHLMRHRTS